LGEFGALFNPGMRHELEERRAKQMLREEEGNARKGDLRIDLESGVAVIPTGRNRGRAGDGEDGDAADLTDGVEDDAGVAPGAGRDDAGDAATTGRHARGTASLPADAEDGDEDAGEPAESEPTRDAATSRGERAGTAHSRSAAAPRQAPRPAGPVPSGKARRAAGGSSPMRSG
jgi:hypothetical protein